MLDELKIMLGLQDAKDNALDERLELIISSVTARLKILLGGIEPPEELAHIVREVSIVRFNRIGSEGLTSHTQEGESLSFGAGDFDGYADEIQAFLDTQQGSARGKVRFL